MATIVTLEIFSGRPNPAWELTDAQEKQLKDRIYGLTQKSHSKTPSVYNRLGYRGFKIQTFGDKDLPNEMIIHANLVDLGWNRVSYIDKNHEIESWLLETAGELMDEEIRSLALEEIRSERNSTDFFDQNSDFSLGSTPAPPYNPGWWNNDPERMRKNNCYNYACNLATNTFAQPGRGSHNMYRQINCLDVGAGANSDGLQNTPPPTQVDLSVALVIWPRRDSDNGHDFHWYRQDNNGFWSHKPGDSAVTNLDDNGRRISNPVDCDRGPYTIFCGYYTFIPGNIRIQ